LGHTVLRPIWQEIEEYAMETLSKKTVEDLCVAAQRAGIESQSQNQFDFMI
jgi:DNA-binding IscR family transcriptional regulator